MTDPIVVVTQVTASNGIGGTYSRTYSYSGARENPERGESAGFERVDEVDSRNGLITRTYFDQAFPTSRMLKKRELLQPDGTTPISRVVVTNTSVPLDPAPSQRYFPYASGTTATQYEVGGTWNGQLLRTVTTGNVYDSSSGTLVDQTVTTSEPASGANGVMPGVTWKTHVVLPLANLVNDTTNWCMGRPGRIEETREHNQSGDGLAATRTTATYWDGPYCRATQIDVEPDIPSLKVITAFEYDDYGNVKTTTVTGAGMPARISRASYVDSSHKTGQFPLSVTNALLQVSTFAWNYDLGVPTGVTDPNDLPTTWDYDVFGRRKREDRPDSTSTTWDYYDCSVYSYCLNAQNKTIFVETELDSSHSYINDVWAYLDQFDRPNVSATRLLDGSYDRKEQQFDALGRLYRTSAPCIWGSCTNYWTTSYFDPLGRVSSVTRPIADNIATLQTSTISHEGLMTRVKDPLLNEQLTTVNAAGQLVKTQDANGSYESFFYDAFGNLTSVQDSVTTAVLQSSSYNIRGMLTGRTDMELGTWAYDPNALGEVIHVRDGGTSSPAWPQTLTYDPLGRLTKREEPEGTSLWEWGTSSANKNIGRLKSVSGPNYSESYTYDSLARLHETEIHADGTYLIDYSYNTIGSVGTVTYPTSTSSYRLTLEYAYQYGQLHRIDECSTQACTTASTSFWTANANNARNQVTQETLGNALVTNRTYDAVTGRLKRTLTGTGGTVQDFAFDWDLAGNLKKRVDGNQAYLTEEFFYDNLYRLDYSTLNGTQNYDVAYDQLGNITYKSDVGTYTYDSTKKHQVVSTSNGWSFAYDANGNMTSGRGAAIDWTSSNYPSCIRMGASCTSSSSSSDWAAFSYTPDRQYWKQVSNYTSGGGATTIYVGGLLEKVSTSGGTEFRHMIRAGDVTIIVSRQNPGTNSVYYVTNDHLGSSSTITNSSGGVVVKESFGAFGARRGSNWTGSPSSGDWSAIASTTRRGFTGHTMLDNLGLIHMNGRVYDQMLGRFLSADPFISEPLNAQNYNRYSYVNNNPLSANDPSGFVEEDTDDDRRRCPCFEFSFGSFFGPPTGMAWFYLLNREAIMEKPDRENLPGPPQMSAPVPTPATSWSAIYRTDRNGMPITLDLGEEWEGKVCDLYPSCHVKTNGDMTVNDTIEESHPEEFLFPAGGLAKWAWSLRTERVAYRTLESTEEIGANVARRARPPNNGEARPHGGTAHNNAIDNRVRELKTDPAVSNIRKNQQQVDVNGNRAGTNKPDLQYDKCGIHHCVEYDTVPKNSIRHGEVIRSNDPNAAVELNQL